MNTGDAPLLSVEGLEVRFGASPPAVCGLDLTVRRGHTVAPIEHAEEDGGRDLLGCGQVARQLLRHPAAGEQELRRIRLPGGRSAAHTDVLLNYLSRLLVSLQEG